MSEDDKKAAAEAAVAEVRDGMLVGLGTGSTAAHAIRALAGRAFTCVATSAASAALAKNVRLPVHDMREVATLDLAIDGVDEIDPLCRAIKGAGGAMLREKVVARAAARMIAIADGSKRVERLGARPVPVELLEFAQASATAALEALGAAVTMRAGYLTDNGNPVADCAFGPIDDPAALAAAIDAIPGALGHGLFLTEIDAAYIAHDGIVTRLERGGPSD